MNHRGFVGPEEEFDVMGATQFRLLCTLGLRAYHKVLDFGCGSLRAGRLLIPYLDKGCYFGIDPAMHHVHRGMKEETSHGLVELKTPQFSYNEDFKTDVFDTQFDYILAQSIFSHASPAMIQTMLENFKASLKPTGVLVFTFQVGGKDSDYRRWSYPTVVGYKPLTMLQWVREAGLTGSTIPWYHPRQQWVVATYPNADFPADVLMALRGDVVGVTI